MKKSLETIERELEAYGIVIRANMREMAHLEELYQKKKRARDRALNRVYLHCTGCYYEKGEFKISLACPAHGNYQQKP